MSIIAKYNEGINFWEANPQFKVIGGFGALYHSDKSKSKDTSSKIMWAISFFCDDSEENRLINLPETDRKSIIEDDYIKDKNFAWDKYKELIELYQKTQMTHQQRTLFNLKVKMEERDNFLLNTKYTLDNARDLDAIISNTPKLFEMVKTLQEEISRDKNHSVMRGGAKESASDKKLM
jgi:hypothetical protein